jgi:hypothetical protein
MYIEHFRARANFVNTRLLTGKIQIDVEADRDMEDDDAWLAQATSFAVTYLSHVPSMTGIWMYADVCLREALEGPYETREPRYRAAMYVPPAAT